MTALILSFMMIVAIAVPGMTTGIEPASLVDVTLTLQPVGTPQFMPGERFQMEVVIDNPEALSIGSVSFLRVAIDTDYLEWDSEAAASFVGGTISNPDRLTFISPIGYTARNAWFSFDSGENFHQGGQLMLLNLRVKEGIEPGFSSTIDMYWWPAENWTDDFGVEWNGRAGAGVHCFDAEDKWIADLVSIPIGLDTYPLFLHGGRTGSSIPARAPAGFPVIVRAGEHDDYLFDGWTSVPEVDFGDTEDNPVGVFTMINQQVDVTANWIPHPFDAHSVTLISEGATGATRSRETARLNQTVEIFAGTRANHRFDGWEVTPSTVTLANANNATTTFTMPNEPVTVVANWTEYHGVIVNESRVTPAINNGHGDHDVGSTVVVAAGARANYRFTGWTVLPASFATEINNLDASIVYFEMPNHTVTLTANWANTDNEEIGQGPANSAPWPPSGGTSVIGFRTHPGTDSLAWRQPSQSAATFLTPAPTHGVTQLASEALTTGNTPLILAQGNWTRWPSEGPLIEVNIDGNNIIVRGSNTPDGAGTFRSHFDAHYNAATDQARLFINAAGQYGVIWGGTPGAGWTEVELGGGITITPRTQFAVTVHDSYAANSNSVSGAGSYCAGVVTGPPVIADAIIGINAGRHPQYPNFVFERWEVNSGGITLSDINNPVAYFTMPENAVSVTAIWAEGEQYPLTANAGAGGTVSVVPSGTAFFANTPITITPNPNAGYRFVNWTGDFTGTANPLTFNMPADSVTVTANFELIPTFNLTVTPDGNGTVSVSPTGNPVAAGTPVSITATADTGYVFTGWVGNIPAATGTTIPLTFNMPEQDVTITATFAEIQPNTLTVTAVGNGTVSPESDSFVTGAPVSITATPGTGYRLVSWEGNVAAATGSASPLTFNMPAHDVTITATFAPIPTFNLAVNVAGDGSVSHESGPFEEGDPVSITATPGTGYRFVGWSGNVAAATGNTSPLTFNMPAHDVTITAEFEPIPTFTLTVNVAGDGSVSHESGPFEEGAPISITATANGNYVFTGWSGNVAAATGTASSITFNMPAHNVTITATFAEPQPGEHLLSIEAGIGSTPPSGFVPEGTTVYLDPGTHDNHTFAGWTSTCIVIEPFALSFVMPTHPVTLIAIWTADEFDLTVNVDGDGSVSLSSGSFAVGAPVSITATANAGYEFVGWSGDELAVGTANPLTFNMPARDVTITATFVPETLPTLTALTIGNVALTEEQSEEITSAADVLAILNSIINANATFDPADAFDVDDLTITWSFDGTFDPTPGAANTFTWTVSGPNGLIIPAELETGTITVTNHDPGCIKIGDLTGNGRISIMDVALLRTYVVDGPGTLTASVLARIEAGTGNVSGGATLTMTDVEMLRTYVMGMGHTLDPDVQERLGWHNAQ